MVGGGELEGEKIPDGMEEGEKKGWGKWKDKLGFGEGVCPLQIKLPLIVVLPAQTKCHRSK